MKDLSQIAQEGLETAFSVLLLYMGVWQAKEGGSYTRNKRKRKQLTKKKAVEVDGTKKRL